MTCVLWNAIPRDWADPDGWIDVALERCKAQDWTLMVLHDIPGGAMRHLDRFIGMVADAGGNFCQEFPPDCMPVVDGTIVLPIEQYVAPRRS